MTIPSDDSRSPTRALVLGGGGPVGRAWETGLVASFLALGIDLDRANLIIGTSAGSIAGAELALHLDIIRSVPASDSSAGSAPSPAPTSGMQQLLVAMIRVTNSSEPEVELKKIGQMALAARTVSEEGSLGRAALAAVTGREWPPNFWTASISTSTGHRQVWNVSSEVPLDRAVASSAALPGIWPPITVGDDRYMDGGVRSLLNADLAAGYAHIVIVSCFRLIVPQDTNNPAASLIRALLKEIDSLRKGGSVVEVIVPDEEYLALTKNGMDMLSDALVPDAYDAGKRQALDEADWIHRLWSLLE